MDYLIFAALLVGTNVVTFYYSFRGGIRATAKTLNDISNERKVNIESRRSLGRTEYSKNKLVEYLMEDYGEAKRVLDLLIQAADKYGCVSIADYYDLIKIDSNLKDYGYGWNVYSISQSIIVPVLGKFMIKFPPFEALSPVISVEREDS